MCIGRERASFPCLDMFTFDSNWYCGFLIALLCAIRVFFPGDVAKLAEASRWVLAFTAFMAYLVTAKASNFWLFNWIFTAFVPL